MRRTVEAFALEPFIATMTLDEGLHNGAHISRRNSYIPLLKSFIERRIAPALLRGAERGEFRAHVDPERFSWLVFSMSTAPRSEEHTPESQSLTRISYAFFCLNK